MDLLLTEVPRIALKFTTVIKTHQEMLLGILRYAHQHGPWALQIFTGRNDEQPPTKADVFSGLIGLFTRKEISRGVLISTHDDPRMEPGTTGIIMCDNKSMADAAADFFLDHGFTSFAYVGALRPTRWSKARAKFFRMRVTAAKHTCKIYPQPSKAVSSCVTCEQKVLGEWLSRLPEHTGVFVANDVRGRQVLEACRLYEIPVPERLSVLSCDNEEVVCETTTPTLSSMRMSCEEAGYQAAKVLDAALHGTIHAEDTPIIIPYGFTELIERQSTMQMRRADPLIERAITIIRLNVTEGLSVPNLATRLNVSRRLLELRFRAGTGHSPHQEIMAAKLQRVKALLKQNTLTLEAIAERCGFANASHLCQVFKRTFGLTPAGYRQRAPESCGSPKRS